jgi:pimeloyl-ACP methyl ester carboxylesterase
MKTRARDLALAAALGAISVLGLVHQAMAAAPVAVRNIVLVHGALADGSTWRGVYDVLTRDGFNVRVVQQPLTGLADDVAATQRVLDQLQGPVVLVGHSYGGTIITVAGTDPKVKALVYVAAMQPDVGESTNKLASSRPGSVPSSDLTASADGFVFFDPKKFPSEVAADVPLEEARYLAHAQMPVAAAAFDAPVSAAAWREKPSFAVLATEDQELSPELAHWMYARSRAKVTELKGSHLVYVAQPRAVARIIEEAARTAD